MNISALIMVIQNRSHIPRKSFRFIRKVVLVSVMMIMVLLSNGGYMILSALHFDTLAGAVQTPQAQATTNGQMSLYFHKEPSDKNETYNSLSFTPPEPGADTAAGTPATNTYNSAAPALCEGSTNTGETYNRNTVINNSTAHEGCAASFISPPVGQTITVSVGDTAPTAVLWTVDSVSTVAGSEKIYLYKWDGTTLTNFVTLTSVTDPSTSITSATWTSSAFTGTTINPTDRIVAIVTKIFTSTGTGNSSFLFDSSARAASKVVLKYSAIAPNKPSLAGAKDDDFTVGAATTACSTSGVAYNTKWTCLQGTAASTAGEFNNGNAAGTVGDTNGWFWLNNKRTAVGAVSSNFGTTPSNTYLYQTLDVGYGDGLVRTAVNTTMDYTIGATNPTTPYSHSGLVLWLSNTDYLEVQAYSTGAKGAANTTYVALNTNGTLSGATSLNSSISSGLYNRVWVGFQNTGGSYQAQYSTDGTTWNNIGSPVSHAAFTRVGLNSYSGIPSTVVSQHAGAFAWFQHTFAAPVNTLTVSATAGTQAATLNAGDTSQYVNTTGCASAATCAAFTMSVSLSAVTITSIKVTEVGTANANANMSNFALFYDTDGNYNNGVTGQYGSTVVGYDGTDAVNVSGSLVVNPGTTYYFYVRTDIKNGASASPSGGQTMDFQIVNSGDVVASGSPVVTISSAALGGTVTVLPNATATTYGASLADGGRSNESITISGYGFDSPPGGSRANCSGAVGTGCVRFLVGGAATVADGDITAWSNNSITYTINPGLATIGGTNAVEVVAGGQSDANDLTFLIYPNVTGMAVCPTCGTNAAREYNVADTEGIVMVQGDHFGSAAGTATFGGGFGSLAGTIHATAEGPCTTGGWSAASFSSNTVCVEVNSSISNSVYTGTVVINRNSDAKTDYIDLRILPRIISNSPTSAIKGATIQILGDHLCESGACPTVGSRSTVSDNVLFGTFQAPDGDFLALSGGAGACNGAGAAWTHTEICVKVPAAASSGSRPTQATSNNSYVSNTKAFTILSSIPNDPTALAQYQTDGVTPIAIGGFITVGNMVHAADISASLAIGMALQIESKPIGTSFACGAGNCVDAEEGTVVGGGACTSCTTLNNAQLAHTHADGSYHWQARVRNTTTNEYSNWVSFGGNAETAADYVRDTTAPAITSGPGAVADTNSATITWGTSGEQSTSQVQYNTTGTFVSNCATNNDCTVLDTTYAFNHTVVLGNLDSNTTYYYRVRSKDASGNEMIGSTLSFATGGVTQPGKTISFHIIGRTTAISGGGSAAPTFSVLIPENAPIIKSAFVEMTGISGTTGTNTIGMQVNGQAIGSYIIDAASKTQFKILYSIDPANVNINDDPAINTLTISPSLDTYISSAKIVVTYAYTP